MMGDGNVEGIIDRFEGDLAVLETPQGMIRIKRLDLPADAGEGDVAVQKNGVWVVEQSGNRLRKEKITRLADELWEDQDS